jgi:putative aldouronate transport system substrate-binding protein
MSAAFITGTADIEKEWDEYVATFEKMSLGKVLEVYQAAYDRWNATLASLK